MTWRLELNNPSYNTAREGKMPRKKATRDPHICPSCGTKVEKPVKTWQLVSPLPDAYGRITITIMGSFRCPNCGESWRTVISKVKAGDRGIEVEGARGRKKLEAEKPPRREGEIIEIDIDDIDEEEL